LSLPLQQCCTEFVLSRDIAPLLRAFAVSSYFCLSLPFQQCCNEVVLSLDIAPLLRAFVVSSYFQRTIVSNGLLFLISVHWGFWSSDGHRLVNGAPSASTFSDHPCYQTFLFHWFLSLRPGSGLSISDHSCFGFAIGSLQSTYISC
jgi:hypothetical protein